MRVRVRLRAATNSIMIKYSSLIIKTSTIPDTVACGDVIETINTWCCSYRND